MSAHNFNEFQQMSNNIFLPNKCTIRSLFTYSDYLERARRLLFAVYIFWSVEKYIYTEIVRKLMEAIKIART